MADKLFTKRKIISVPLSKNHHHTSANPKPFHFDFLLLIGRIFAEQKEQYFP
ncbi:MAG: hypothetical protein ACFCU8_07340 [Thermosynechococcaceae cyanobacterium]